MPRCLDGVAILTLIGALVGIGAHTYYAREPAPDNVLRPNWSNVWLAAFVAFFAIQLPSQFLSFLSSKSRTS
jgi:hypothetical protein